MDLGLGAGAFWDAIEAYGEPRRAPASRSLGIWLGAYGPKALQLRGSLTVGCPITHGPNDGMLTGPADHWVDGIVDFAVSHRFDTFIFWGEGEDQLDQLAQEVVPAARERFAALG